MTPIYGLEDFKRKAAGLYIVLEAEALRRYGRRLEELAPEELRELLEEKLRGKLIAHNDLLVITPSSYREIAAATA